MRRGRGRSRHVVWKVVRRMYSYAVVMRNAVPLLVNARQKRNRATKEPLCVGRLVDEALGQNVRSPHVCAGSTAGQSDAGEAGRCRGRHRAAVSRYMGAVFTGTNRIHTNRCTALLHTCPHPLYPRCRQITYSYSKCA